MTKGEETRLDNLTRKKSVFALNPSEATHFGRLTVKKKNEDAVPQFTASVVAQATARNPQASRVKRVI